MEFEGGFSGACLPTAETELSLLFTATNYPSRLAMYQVVRSAPLSHSEGRYCKKEGVTKNTQNTQNTQNKTKENKTRV